MSDHGHKPADDGKKYWLDQKKNVDLIVFIIYAICAGLFFADFFYEKHPYYDIENVPNFYGFYGFVGCFFLVVAAAQLRKILMKDEDYYQKKEGPQFKPGAQEGEEDKDG